MGYRPSSIAYRLKIKEVFMLPDTLEGALALSVVDFFMSLLFISFIGVVLYFFPLFDKVEALFMKRGR